MTLTIIIPMAGRGNRFAEAGWTDPKPLILIKGQPMIKHVIDNLRPRSPHQFVFVCQRAHVEMYDLSSKLKEWAPGCIIVEIDGITQGAACTVLKAKQYIGQGPLMIANSDQYISADINHYLAALTEQYAGLIMTMKADDPKWSFVRVNPKGEVLEVVEKQVVSDEATVGIYNFKNGLDFVHYAEKMILDNLTVNNEFYVAPVYNELIKRGGRVALFNIGAEGSGLYGLGTPKDLALFLDHPASDNLGVGNANS